MKKLLLALVAMFLLAAPAQAAPDPIQTYIYDKCLPSYGKARAAEKAAYYAPLIRRAAAKHKLKPQLVAALVWYESNYDPRARSYAGALGLAQVIPFRGRFKPGSDPFDPATNLDVGCRLLAGYHALMKKRYPGLPERALWHRTLVSYNMGPGGVVNRGVTRSRYSTFILRDARYVASLKPQTQRRASHAGFGPLPSKRE